MAEDETKLLDRFIAHVVVNYRWVLVVFILLPLSFLYEIWFYCRNSLIFWLNTAPDAHGDKVRYVQKQVRDWCKDGKQVQMCTARPGWLTMSFRQAKYKKTMRNISINLLDILKDIIPFGNHPLFRYLMGWMVPLKVSFLKLTQCAAVKKLYEEHHMIQDMLVPMSVLTETLKLFHTEVQIYPLWLCPFVLPYMPGLVHPAEKDAELYVDIGAYGTPKVSSFVPELTTRRIDKFVNSVNGFQMMYADLYMSRDEFWQMFDNDLYQKMRSKYNCAQAFPDVFDKVRKSAKE